MKFKIGDKVKCVEPEEVHGLLEGNVYTLLEYNDYFNTFRVSELKGNFFWRENRFVLTNYKKVIG